MNNDRNKVVSDLDLNSPPAGSQEGNLTSREDAVSAATSCAANSQPLPNIGSYSTPIIIDSDEAEMLSLSIGFPQMRNQSTRSIMKIVLDEDVERNPRQSGNVMEDPATTLTLFTHNKGQSVPPNMTIINCGHFQDTDADRSPKRRIVTRPTQEPAKVVLEELNDEPAKVVPKKNNEEPEKMPDVEPINKPIEEPAKKPNSEPAKEIPTVTCPICLNPLAEASSTICGHLFCPGCIKKAIRGRKSCPTCRKKITGKDIHPIFLPR